MAKALQFDCIPSRINYGLLIESMLGNQFIMRHDLRNGRTMLILEGETKLGKLAGFSFHEGDADLQGKFNCMVVYNSLPERMQERVPQALESLYSLFGGEDAELLVSFAPSTPDHIKKVRRRIEEMASSKEVRITRQLGSGRLDPQGSLQMDVYHESDEKRILLSLLEMLNEIALSNDASYKVSVLVNGATGNLRNYVRSRLYVLDEFDISAQNTDALMAKLRNADAIPFSSKHSSNMVVFSGSIKRAEVIEGAYRKSTGSVAIGEYLEGGMSGFGEQIRVDRTVFNLGTIITGLPGSGKTMSAMHILGQLSHRCSHGAVIISPTQEWDNFGQQNGMHVVRLYAQGNQINFFKCDSDINIERFYENLAILLASASNAGPYRNSLEKSLLAAFHKVYGKTRCPDPTEVYAEIEKAVIDQHAKRAGIDITYTKHGENVMAALENLRLMLLKPEFSYPEGINFVDMIRKGAVFDLSLVSNNIKPFFYALILNQVYGIADSLDIYGDNDLRMIICLEEAQLVFGNSEESAATYDLKQRIQDFRKKGVGLMMVTHNITDINLGIRRLCQLKLYFRQSADVAKYASADLNFPADYQDAVLDKMKDLGHGVCALSYISTNGLEKNLEPSIFVRMPQSSQAAGYIPYKEVHAKSELLVPTRITLQSSDGRKREGTRVELFYVGERVFEGFTGPDGMVTVEDTLKGKAYSLYVYGEKRRDTRKFRIVGGKETTLTLA